jgi:predicted TIM-barrel fold metal-dependent hydrolase
MTTILEHWQQGEGLPGVLVIDGHTHIAEWPHGATFSTPEECAEKAVMLMDAHGVEASCALGGGYWFNGSDYHMGNDFLLDCVRLVPDRLVPFAHVNPNDDWPPILAELERMLSEGVRCFKLINAYQASYPGDGPNLIALYEFAEHHRLLLINHHWSEAELRAISPRFPHVIFIRAHGGASALSHELPNVYDNIWGLSPLGAIEAGVRRYGPDKILLGSDAFMNDFPVGIGLVVYADIPEDHKRAILGLNMARLLHRVGALPSSLQMWLP